LFALERAALTLDKVGELFGKNFRILRDLSSDGQTYESMPPYDDLRIEFSDDPEDARVVVEISFKGTTSSDEVPLLLVEQQLKKSGWSLWCRYKHPSRMLLFGKQGVQIRMEHNGLEPITIILLGE
jgi:hypothetical protein